MFQTTVNNLLFIKKINISDNSILDLLLKLRKEIKKKDS